MSWLKVTSWVRPTQVQNLSQHVLLMGIIAVLAVAALTLIGTILLYVLSRVVGMWHWAR